MKKKDIDHLKKITINLSKINVRSVEESKIIEKGVFIDKYNSSHCSVNSFYRPISKIVNDQIQ